MYLQSLVRGIGSYKIVIFEPKAIGAIISSVQVFSPCIQLETADPKMKVQADIRKMLFNGGIILQKELTGNGRKIIRGISSIISCLNPKSQIEVAETQIALIPKLVPCN